MCNARYEAAMAGLRGAGSPMMYDRMFKIIGDPASTTTPTALRALSQTMHSYLDTAQQLKQATGHRPLPDLKQLPNAEPGIVDQVSGAVRDVAGRATQPKRDPMGIR